MIIGLARKLPIAGNGALIVNVNPVLVPPAVDTVTVRVPGEALRSIASLAVTDVALPATIGSIASSCAPMCSGTLATVTVSTVMPLPLIVTVVAPGTNPVPLNVTSSVLPGGANDGFALAIVGVIGVIVRVCPDVVPAGVVTVRKRAPISAASATARRVVIDVLLAMATSLTVMPEPVTATVLPATKLVPVSVTVVAAPLMIVPGETDVSVGAAGGAGV